MDLVAALAEWRVVYGAIAFALLGLAVAPNVMAAFLPVRRLRPAERVALDRAGAAPAADAVRVVADDRPTALAVGLLPHRGRVYVTSGLVEGVSGAEFAAVVLHELGHLHRGHVLLRVGLPSAFVSAWVAALALDVPLAFGGGLALAAPVALASFRVSRWTEFDADAYAAARGAAPALADALETLEGGNTRPASATRRRTVANLLARHPDSTARIDRLRRPGPGGRRVGCDRGR
jgi:STE24 endopeptidase